MLMLLRSAASNLQWLFVFLFSSAVLLPCSLLAFYLSTCQATTAMEIIEEKSPRSPTFCWNSFFLMTLQNCSLWHIIHWLIAGCRTDREWYCSVWWQIVIHLKKHVLLIWFLSVLWAGSIHTVNCICPVKLFISGCDHKLAIISCNVSGAAGLLVGLWSFREDESNCHCASQKEQEHLFYSDCCQTKI